MPSSEAYPNLEVSVYNSIYTVFRFMKFLGDKQLIWFCTYTDGCMKHCMVSAFLSVCEKNTVDLGGIRTHDLLLTCADVSFSYSENVSKCFVFILTLNLGKEHSLFKHNGQWLNFS